MSFDCYRISSFLFLLPFPPNISKRLRLQTMKTSILAVGSVYPVLAGLLLPLASSIYIDPTTNRRTYPHVTLTTRRLQRIGGEAPRLAEVEQDIAVPLTDYHDYKVNLEPVASDPYLSQYLTEDLMGLGSMSEEPYLLVTMGGRLELQQEEKYLPKIVKRTPPVGAHKYHCWLDLETGGRINMYNRDSTDVAVSHIECIAFFFNKDFARDYQNWLFSDDIGVRLPEPE